MIAIREATAKGYVEIKPGDVFDASYPESKTRRGRLQGGGEICPTLTAGQTEIYYFEDETDGDTDMGAERGGEGEKKGVRGQGREVQEGQDTED